LAGRRHREVGNLDRSRAAGIHRSQCTFLFFILHKLSQGRFRFIKDFPVLAEDWQRSARSSIQYLHLVVVFAGIAAIGSWRYGRVAVFTRSSKVVGAFFIALGIWTYRCLFVNCIQDALAGFEFSGSSGPGRWQRARMALRRTWQVGSRPEKKRSCYRGYSFAG